MLIAVIKKELLLVSRDIHALLVLFLLPIVFILIMSMALQDRMSPESKDQPKVGLWVENGADQNSDLTQTFSHLEGLRVEQVNSQDQLTQLLVSGEILGGIILPAQFSKSIDSPVTDKSEKLQIIYAASLPNSLRRSILGAVREALGAYQVNKLFEYDDLTQSQRQARVDHLLGRSLVTSQTQGSDLESQPNSVQQSVPAWLIFSMFFVVLPISTTLLTERQQGTLQRLQTLPVPNSYLLIGKIIPYLGINLVQAALMLLVGIYLVPLVTGEGLHLVGETWLLAPLILTTSLSAISFALLIATRAKTTEQATTLGGISNLILAAIGGIMVPTFVMPELMQQIAALSPMNWALEGFFSILLRQGGWAMVGPEILKLLAFSGCLFLLSLYSYRGLTDTK
ncbi:MAG: ABC transporter permease [Candidatus Thiodiazotropha sp. 6PLUC2]